MKQVHAFQTEAEAQRIGWLVAGFLQQRLNDLERDELDAWITASDKNQLLFEELISPAFADEGFTALKEIDTEGAYNRIRERLIPATNKKRGADYGIKRMLAVAASVVLIISIALVYRMTNKKTESVILNSTTEKIVPGGHYAELVTGTGKRISLAGLKNGLIDSLDGIEVLKTAEGQLSYLENEAARNEVHELRTPTGGQYKLVLPDGSIVWLNAGSSLRFPVRFDGKERRVELSGEGYFEVVSADKLLAANKDQKRQPFIVAVNGFEVEVLGTHFNIHAYADEESSKTTLLEGKVRIVKGAEKDKSGDLTATREEVILQPGEQAIVTNADGLTVEKLLSTDHVIAWKDGLFDFKNATIEEVMLQAKRWYTIDTVIYKTKITKRFDADILRKESIEELLNLLELTGGVHFKIENKTIYVLP